MCNLNWSVNDYGRIPTPPEWFDFFDFLCVEAPVVIVLDTLYFCTHCFIFLYSSCPILPFS